MSAYYCHLYCWFMRKWVTADLGYMNILKFHLVTFYWLRCKARKQNDRAFKALWLSLARSKLTLTYFNFTLSCWLGKSLLELPGCERLWLSDYHTYGRLHVSLCRTSRLRSLYIILHVLYIFTYKKIKNRIFVLSPFVLFYFLQN